MLDLRGDPIALTAALVDIPSESRHEQRIADEIEAALRAQTQTFEIIRNGDAVLARTHHGRASRVLLAGHTDTVPAADNVPSRLADGVLHGCGTSDMKSGDAVFLHLAATVTEPTHDLTLVMYDCEEIESAANGLGRIQRELPDWLNADLAILGEPTGGYIEAGCQGTLRVVVSAAGTRAHSARSWLGDNAIHKLGDVLARLKAYRARNVDIDGCTYREGLSAVGIDGGVAGNVIPDAASVTVNFRFAPDRSARQALRHVREVFDGLEVAHRADRRRRRRTAWADQARRRCPRRRRRRPGARQVRLDRRCAVLGAGYPGGELWARRPQPRPPCRRARRDRADHRGDGHAAGVFNRLSRRENWTVNRPVSYGRSVLVHSVWR